MKKITEIEFNKEGICLIKSGRKTVCKIYDRKTFFGAKKINYNYGKNRFSAEFPKLGGGFERETVESLIEVINRWIDLPNNVFIVKAA
jgi:hypothetical protein